MTQDVAKRILELRSQSQQITANLSRLEIALEQSSKQMDELNGTLRELGFDPVDVEAQILKETDDLAADMAGLRSKLMELRADVS